MWKYSNIVSQMPNAHFSSFLLRLNTTRWTGTESDLHQLVVMLAVASVNLSFGKVTAKLWWFYKRIFLAQINTHRVIQPILLCVDFVW